MRDTQQQHFPGILSPRLQTGTHLKDVYIQERTEFIIHQMNQPSLVPEVQVKNDPVLDT